MTGGGGIWRSSTSRWKPLFKFSRSTAVVPVSEAQTGTREASAVQKEVARTSLKEVGGANSVLPHAWAPGALVLNGSGRPVHVGDKEPPTSPTCPGAQPPPPAAQLRQPSRGILVAGGGAGRAAAERPARALTFLKGLVTEAVEPPLLWLDSDVVPVRGCKRKATGFHFGQVEPEQGGSDQTEDRPKKDEDVRSNSSGFSSDDEFAELEELAAKNARANREATKLAVPVKLGANPRIESSSQIPNFTATDAPPLLPSGPPAPPQRQGSKDSSFASSSDGEPEPPKPKPKSASSAPGPAQAQGFFISSPTAGQAGGGPQAAARLKGKGPADDASSFASSSDGDGERQRKPPAAAGPTAQGFSSVSQASVAPVPPAPKPRSEGGSSFCSSSDGEDLGKRSAGVASKAFAAPAFAQAPAAVAAVAAGAPSTAGQKQKRQDTPCSSFASSSDGGR